MYKKGIRIELIGVFIVACILLAFILPRQIAKHSAIKYMEMTYPNQEFEYVKVEIDKRVRIGNYVVVFKVDGETQKLWMGMWPFPNDVIYDPLNPPG